MSETYDNLLQQPGKLCKPKRQITAPGVVNQQWSDKSSSGECTALPVCSAALHAPSNADNNAFHRLSAHSKAKFRHTRWAVPTAAIECSQSIETIEKTAPFGINLMRSQVLYQAAQVPIGIFYQQKGHACNAACAVPKTAVCSALTKPHCSNFTCPFSLRTTAFQTCVHVPVERWHSLPLGQSSWQSQPLHCRFA